MYIVADIAVGIVALLHFYFLVLEMFLWEKPIGLRTFWMDKDFAAATRILAANQGLYNGFLAVGLLWSLYTGDVHVQRFFLGCVVTAGVYGSFTADARVLWVQGAPGALAFILTELA